MKNNYLIIGSNGLLGSQFKKNLNIKKKVFYTIAKKNSDFNINLSNFSKLDKIIKKNNIKYVINCAANIDINDCAKNFKRAKKINYLLPKYLNTLSFKYSFKLIHISSDQVYFSKTKKLKKETDRIFGLNNYAKLKVLSDKEVQKNINNLIIRTNFTGTKKSKKNITFIDWLYMHYKNKKKCINLFHDLYTSTIDVNNCVNLILKLIDMNCSGVYNLGSKQPVSKETFGRFFFKKMKSKILINSTSSDLMNVKRSKFLGLNVKKIEKDLKIKMPNYKKIINSLCKEYK